MREARDLAKNARKIGDYGAAQTHKQDAISHESEMKSLDKRAAKIIFKENNKVRGHRVAVPTSCPTFVVVPGSQGRNG
jgi:hypothetical protein